MTTKEAFEIVLQRVEIDMIEPSDGAIYGQVIEELGLTDEGGDVKLLIIGTQQGD